MWLFVTLTMWIMWRSIRKQKHLWNIAYLSETQLNYVAQDVTIAAKAPIEEDLETDVAWNLELKGLAR